MANLRKKDTLNLLMKILWMYSTPVSFVSCLSIRFFVSSYFAADDVKDYISNSEHEMEEVNLCINVVFLSLIELYFC